MAGSPLRHPQLPKKGHGAHGHEEGRVKRQTIHSTSLPGAHSLASHVTMAPGQAVLGLEESKSSMSLAGQPWAIRPSSMPLVLQKA